MWTRLIISKGMFHLIKEIRWCSEAWKTFVSSIFPFISFWMFPCRSIDFLQSTCRSSTTQWCYKSTMTQQTLCCLCITVKAVDVATPPELMFVFQPVIFALWHAIEIVICTQKCNLAPIFTCCFTSKYHSETCLTVWWQPATPCVKPRDMRHCRNWSQSTQHQEHLYNLIQFDAILMQQISPF